MPTAPSTDHRVEIILEWLIRLRWGAVAGQLVILATARTLLGAPLPLARLLGLVAVLALSNVLLVIARDRRAPRALCGAALTFDILQLSALLHASGGAHNPASSTSSTSPSRR